MKKVPGQATHANNPLGLIALAFVLVEAIAAAAGSMGNFESHQRTTLIWFVVIFAFTLLGVFYWLVTRHHDKLYGPGDFKNEENFMKTIDAKVGRLEVITQQIKEEIENQPLYRYTKLPRAGQLLILHAFGGEPIDCAFFVKGRPQLTVEEVVEQAQILCDDYGWVDLRGQTVTITEKGRREVETFESLALSRYAGEVTDLIDRPDY